MGFWPILRWWWTIEYYFSLKRKQVPAYLSRASNKTDKNNFLVKRLE